MAQKTKTSWWKMDQAELKKQAENYSTLEITKSYRGISMLILLALLGITVFLGYLEFHSWSTVIFVSIVYLPLAFFVYRGHRWAIVSLMILFTFEKGYQLFQVKNIMPIVWWIILMPYFYKALRVENELKRRQQKKNEKDQAGNTNKFCGECGSELVEDDNFCKQCGAKS